MTSPVPPPPCSNEWTHLLHWCVQVMDVVDPDLAFTASILSHALNHGGLTEKQAKYASRIHERLRELYLRNQLPSQLAAVDIAGMPVEGTA